MKAHFSLSSPRLLTPPDFREPCTQRKKKTRAVRCQIGGDRPKSTAARVRPFELRVTPTEYPISMFISFLHLPDLRESFFEGGRGPGPYNV